MNLQPADLQEFLRSRRSIRKFTDAPVADEVLREIIETATYAPSAHGMQPWRFVVVDSQGARSALGAALTGQMRADMQAENAPETEISQRVERSLRRMSEAPKIILLCRDAEAQRAQHPAEEQMGMQSVAMAGLQLMLAARAHGLGTVWICWPLYAGAETRRALKLPVSWQPQGMILLGHPAEEPREKNLKLLDDVTIFTSLR
jgi:F420 biosynthesis protein FbiB-like protein